MVSGCAHTSACVSRLVLPLSYHDLPAIGPVGVDVRPHPARRVAWQGGVTASEVSVSVGHFLSSELCAVLSRALSRATDPIPAAWRSLGSGGSCRRELRALSLQRGQVQSSGAVLLNAAIAGPCQPSYCTLLLRSGSCQTLQQECFPHPGLDHCLQTLLWLPPGCTNSFLLFSQETVNLFAFPGPASLGVWAKLIFHWINGLS